MSLRPMTLRLCVLPVVLWLACVARPASATDDVPVLTAEEARAFLRSLFVASPYRLDAVARAGEIDYRLVSGAPSPWAWPQTGEQRVTVEDDGVHVAVCGDCGDEPAPSEAQLRQSLAPNAWVRSDDARIRAFARAQSRGLTVQMRMRALTAAVRAHMTGGIDYRRYDDAVTALESRTGDCTEFAVLLAAAARARGIPARLVHGLAYSGRLAGRTHVFSPHAWVQAWDGRRWVSYDAAFGSFDAGHIALAIGDGDPAALKGLNRTVRQLRIIDAAGVRRAQETTAAR